MLYAGVNPTSDFIFWIATISLFVIPGLIALGLGLWIGALRARRDCCEEMHAMYGDYSAFRHLENYMQEHVEDEDGFTGIVLTGGNWKHSRNC